MSLWGLVCVAFFLTRYLTPTEGAELGGTLWIAACWLALGTARAWWLWRNDQNFSWKPTAADVAIWLVVVGNCLAAAIVLVTADGDRRAALNGAWEWLSLGVMSLLLKQVFRQPRTARLLTWNLLLLTTLLAGLGLYQHLVWYPRQASDLTDLLRLHQNVEDGQSLLPLEQRRYDELSAALGPEVFTLDETGRQMLLARTKFSVEPIGRFALANSFAGFLLIGLFVVGEQFWRGVRLQKSWTPRLLLGLCLLLILVCFLLTKSRTAMAGLLLAGLWLAAALTISHQSVRSMLLWGAGLTAILGALVAGIAVMGGLDWQVWSEAPKSLEYRIEYWRGTWGVIRENPIFGVGPGNLRQHYLAHKLAGSSEEILDPHNMVLDAWAHGGVLALAGVLCLLGMWIVRMRGVSFDVQSDHLHEPAMSWGASLAGLLSIVLVLGEEWLLQGSVEPTLAALCVCWTAGALVVGGLLKTGETTQPIWLAAGMALLVHLMGSGGLSMPAIFQLLILLLIVTDPGKVTARWTLGSPWWRVCSAICGALLLSCLWSGLLPSLAVENLLDQGRQAVVVTGRTREAEQAFLKAAMQDSLAAEPHHQLAVLHYTRWVASDRTDLREFDEAVREEQAALERDPYGAKRYLLLGTWWLERAEKTGLTEDAEKAVDAFRRAAKLYPNYAPLRAELALALKAQGNVPVEEARQALELDDLNWSKGHVDRVLPAAVRQQMEEILRSSRTN